ncbi:MAG TPA: TadE family protein, partial [Mycobacteriales bacterium]|nr:TadE family protein [Mycobacteriales bacterium]
MKLHDAARALARRDDGSALAEMALVLPMLVLLIIGLIEVGRFGNYAILVGNAARAGVQYGAQNTVTAADVTGMQNRALQDGQSITGLTATASSYCECADGSASTCQPTDCAASHRIMYVH